MTTENGGGDQPKKNLLGELTLAEFAGGAKLCSDSFNQWKNLELWCVNTSEIDRYGGHPPDPLLPLKHYEEYYRKTMAWAPGAADELIKISDPQSVADFDALVDEFNLHLDEIVVGGLDEAEKYIERATKIINAKKSD